MNDFELHPQLAADSMPVTDLGLCALRLVNDRNYPWTILVPRQPGLVDITDLSRPERTILMDEIQVVADALKTVSQCDKLNVASLGNQVPQLHIHVIVRRTDDVAWPQTGWGQQASPTLRPIRCRCICGTWLPRPAKFTL